MNFIGVGSVRHLGRVNVWAIIGSDSDTTFLLYKNTSYLCCYYIDRIVHLLLFLTVFVLYYFIFVVYLELKTMSKDGFLIFLISKLNEAVDC